MELKKYVSNQAVQERIQDILKEKTSQFIISLLSLVNNNSDISECDPPSVINAALTAASLSLPINQNLGFAYIIAYNQKQKDGSYKKVAQFQMGYRGFIQLAQRSGQFKTINVSDVREGEIESKDRLTGEIIFSWIEEREKLPIVGYVGYIELINGFKKSLFLTVDELKQHGMKFSKTAKKGYGLWVDDFDAMASKTVVKMLLSKYAPLTVDMQKATLADQSVVAEDETYHYVDNQPILPEEIAADKENAKILRHIEESKTIKELGEVSIHLTTDAQKESYRLKFETLKVTK